MSILSSIIFHSFNVTQFHLRLNGKYSQTIQLHKGYYWCIYDVVYNFSLWLQNEYNVTNDNFFNIEIQELSVQVLFNHREICKATNNTAV